MDQGSWRATVQGVAKSQTGQVTERAPALLSRSGGSGRRDGGPGREPACVPCTCPPEVINQPASVLCYDTMRGIGSPRRPLLWALGSARGSSSRRGRVSVLPMNPEL